MTKRFVVFITSLALLIFIIGCPRSAPEPAKTLKVETFKVKTVKVELPKTELPKVELPHDQTRIAELPQPESKQESSQEQPQRVEPPKDQSQTGQLPEAESQKDESLEEQLPEDKPTQDESPEDEPSKAEGTKAETQKVEATKAEALKVELPSVEPNETEPNAIKPNQVEPNQVEPDNVKPFSAFPFHHKSADILSSFVNDKGLVDYKKLKRNWRQLRALLAEFAELDPNEYNSWSKEDKIAFWINVYNIKMLKIIIDNYPIKSTPWSRIIWGPYSILNIDKNIGDIGKQKLAVMSEEFTLSKIEQRFFRKEFDEPRVFFALSRASISSPPLRSEPYYGQKLDEQLDDQTRKFLSRPTAFRIDRKNKKVWLSVIFKPIPTWYGNEFISKYHIDKKFKDQPPAGRAVLNFITNYISKRDISFLELKNYSVEYIKYDWTLNDSSIKR